MSSLCEEITVRLGLLCLWSEDDQEHGEPSQTCVRVVEKVGREGGEREREEQKKKKRNWIWGAMARDHRGGSVCL